MKIMGLPLWGVLAASVVFFFIGFLWYGVFFSQMWMDGNSVTLEEAEASSMSWMAVGFLVSLVMVIGLAKVLKWRGWPDMGGAVQTALVLSLCFGAATWAYDLVYIPDHNVGLWIMNSAYLVVGWIVAAVVLTLMK